MIKTQLVQNSREITFGYWSIVGWSTCWSPEFFAIAISYHHSRGLDENKWWHCNCHKRAPFMLKMIMTVKHSTSSTSVWSTNAMAKDKQVLELLIIRRPWNPSFTGLYITAAEDFNINRNFQRWYKGQSSSRWILDGQYSSIRWRLVGRCSSRWIFNGVESNSHWIFDGKESSSCWIFNGVCRI